MPGPKPSGKPCSKLSNSTLTGPSAPATCSIVVGPLTSTIGKSLPRTSEMRSGFPKKSRSNHQLVRDELHPEAGAALYHLRCALTYVMRGIARRIHRGEFI